MYFDILRYNSVDVIEGKKYKPYLKSLIQSSISNVVFQKPVNLRESELLMSSGTVRKLVSDSFSNEDYGDIEKLMSAAKILRQELPLSGHSMAHLMITLILLY